MPDHFAIVEVRIPFVSEAVAGRIAQNTKRYIESMIAADLPWTGVVVTAATESVVHHDRD